MCAGDLRHVVQLRSPRWSDDGYGGSENEFVQKGQMFCKVIEQSGRETEHRQRLEGKRIVKFITRYRKDLRQDDEIIFECYPHNILQINDLDRLHRFIEITTERGEKPIDKIDIVDELYVLTIAGEVMIDNSNEAIVQNNNAPISNISGLNLRAIDGETITALNDSTCGV